MSPTPSHNLDQAVLYIFPAQLSHVNQGHTVEVSCWPPAWVAWRFKRVSMGLTVNRQPSKGQKINRQPSNGRAKISRQISQISLNDRDRLTKIGPSYAVSN